ncbi:MAG: trypsin-like peptidase domain-containing protein [Salinivirgaceae bacterium]|nr:trypsin-like peptidase domain-containing protein [Salinivirgaceae bacterium]
MKNLFYCLLSAVIGGFVSVGVISKIEKKQANPVSVPPVVVPTNLSTVADFTVAAQKTVDAVVHVKIRSQQNSYENIFLNYIFGHTNRSSEQAPVVSSGSGVIVSPDGYIVTNNHVVEGARLLEVVLNDKRTFNASIVGCDPTTDIALLKIDGTNFPFMEWGDSESLKVGEWVLAVGNPFNLASTVTAGIVSAKARSINVINKNAAIEAFIQTDAAVNPGNSGGALVNVKGELIGINTAIESPTGTFSGYSFAVPERIARKVVADLKEFGKVQRAFIGVSITENNAQLAKQMGIGTLKGVYVTAVAEGGAAKAAGICSGDVILSIDGNEVNKVSELQQQVGSRRPGEQVEVLVFRNGNEVKMTIVLRGADAMVM